MQTAKLRTERNLTPGPQKTENSKGFMATMQVIPIVPKLV